MLRTEEKQAIIKDFKKHTGDTGSSEVQVALLTARIAAITEHVRNADKDVSSKRGLSMLVARRRKHLEYIKKQNENAYKEILARLDLRK